MAHKPTITTATLLTSSWDSSAKTYSFETNYPMATYDIEIALDSTATEEQAEEIAAYIEDNSDAEVEINEGNQPVYSFIIGVE